MNRKWDEEQMDFAKNLQMFRKQANLSQEDLADRLHISRQAVSKWEIGQSTPDLDTCMKLCEILDVTPDALLLGREAEEKPDIPAKRNPWTTIAVLCTIYLMVACVCGTILLVINLYNGEIFEPIVHNMAVRMINVSFYVFVATMVIIATIWIVRFVHYLKEKRDQKA